MATFEDTSPGLAAVGRQLTSGSAIDIFFSGNGVRLSTSWYRPPDGWHVESPGSATLILEPLQAYGADQNFPFKPSAVSWASDRLDMFAVNAAGELWHFWAYGEQQRPTDWNGEQLPYPAGVGPLSCGPSAVTQGPDRITVFARNGVGTLVACVWDPANGHRWNWTSALGLGWAREPKHVAFATTACSWDASRIDVFAATGNPVSAGMVHTWQQDFPGSPAWHPDYWEDVPSEFGLTSSPVAVSWTDPQRILVVYCTGGYAAIPGVSMTRWIDDHWEAMSPNLYANQGGLSDVLSYPAIASWGKDRADVFFFRGDGLVHLWNPDAGGTTGWSDPEVFSVKLNQ